MPLCLQALLFILCIYIFVFIVNMDTPYKKRKLDTTYVYVLRNIVKTWQSLLMRLNVPNLSELLEIESSLEAFCKRKKMAVTYSS